MYRLFWVLFALSLLGNAQAVIAAPPDQTITVETTDKSYVLSVPVSRLVMVLSKGNFVLKSIAIGGATNNPRYFYFKDSKNSMIISGWFEPARAFHGIEAFWNNETTTWKQKGFPRVQKVSFSKIGGWETIAYDLAIPGGTNSNLRAHWIQAGTWIDLHLSLTSSRTSEDSRAILFLLLQTVSVSVKP